MCFTFITIKKNNSNVSIVLEEPPKTSKVNSKFKPLRQEGLVFTFIDISQYPLNWTGPYAPCVLLTTQQGPELQRGLLGVTCGLYPRAASSINWPMALPLSLVCFINSPRSWGHTCAVSEPPCRVTRAWTEIKSLHFCFLTSVLSSLSKT